MTEQLSQANKAEIKYILKMIGVQSNHLSFLSAMSAKLKALKPLRGEEPDLLARHLARKISGGQTKSASYQQALSQFRFKIKQLNKELIERKI